MKTLSEMNYLRYDEPSKRYYLGMRVVSLGVSVLQSMELREIARPYLEMLSRECNRTVNLAVLEKEEMVYIERIRVPSLRDFSLFVSSVGNRMPVWNTSVGRAVLAYLKPEKLREIIACAVNIVVEAEDISVDELKSEYAQKLIRLGRKLSRALGHRESGGTSATLSPGDSPEVFFSDIIKAGVYLNKRLC